jgi:hypothetical protein
MSACNDFAEMVAFLAQDTGAPPHQLMPLARRLRRLATNHQRRCVMECNGCPRCDGFSPRPGVWVAPTHPPATEEERDRCPMHGTDTLEDVIRATCAELDKFRHVYESRVFTHFTPVFQHDPRGATCSIRVPSGRSNMGDRERGIWVPTSGRA